MHACIHTRLRQRQVDHRFAHRALSFANTQVVVKLLESLGTAIRRQRCGVCEGCAASFWGNDTTSMHAGGEGGTPREVVQHDTSNGNALAAQASVDVVSDGHSSRASTTDSSGLVPSSRPATAMSAPDTGAEVRETECQEGVDRNQGRTGHSGHECNAIDLLVAVRVLAAMDDMRPVLERAGAIPALLRALPRESGGGKPCGAVCHRMEAAAALGILAVIKPARHGWACRPVVSAWRQIVLDRKESIKIIRGRPMAEPDREGLGTLDPLEFSYYVYYRKELQRDEMQAVRDAASRVARAAGGQGLGKSSGRGGREDLRRVNTAVSEQHDADTSAEDAVIRTG